MNELTSWMEESLGATGPLAVAYTVVTILVVIMAIVAGVMKIVIMVRYAKANKMHISSNLTGVEAARYILDKEGYSQITVKKAGFWRELIFGNYYNVLTKTIYLRSVLFQIDDRRSVTSTAVAVQKAAIAKLCEDGDRQTLTRNRLSLIGIFGPFLFIPLLLLGLVLDFFILQTNGLCSLVFLAGGGFLLVAGFIVTLLNIPVEKKANALALKMMEETGLANEEELPVMKKVFDTYIISYVCDFILEVLRIVQFILEIAVSIKKD
jgi:Predicted Zn-dependent protease